MRDWEKEGMTWVVVARERTQTNGWVEVGAFLIDAWCLGVKNAFADEMNRAELTAFLDEQLPAEERESMEPGCARQLIESAAAYAQSLGFLPHRDFRKARKVFGSLDPTACATRFVFGREGRPCFVVGPDDDEARIKRVLAVLTARFGEDGFNFTGVAREPGDEGSDEDAIDELISGFFLFIENGHAPNPALTSFEANGFLAGLSLLPELPPSEEWVPAMWGGAEFVPVHADNIVKAMVEEGMFCVLDRTADDFDAAHFYAAVPTVSESDHVEMTARYCTGLRRALALRPSVLMWLRGHPESADAAALLERIAAAKDEHDPIAQTWKERGQEPGDTVGELMAALFARTRELRSPER